MNELLRDLRSNGPLLLAKTVALGLLLLSVFHIGSFTRSADAAVDRSFSAEAEVDLYSVVDTLWEDADYSDFRQSGASVNRLAAFYNGLDEERSFRLLTTTAQPMPIADFRGGDVFDAGYGSDSGVRGEYVYPEAGGARLRDVKSLQLNRQAFEFYHLRVGAGSGIDWAAVDYSTGRIPVLLGADYRGIYELGDVLDAQYYFFPKEFEVVGFLEPDSSVFDQGELNTFLDDHIVVPYPERLDPVNPADQEFQGILYFAMVNSDIAAPTGSSPDDVLATIGRISDRTGFQDYTLLNMPTYLVQYRLMKQIIQDNLALLIGLGLLLATAVLAMNALLSALVAQRRAAASTVLHLQGHRRQIIDRRNARLVLAEYAALAAVLAAVMLTLPNANPTVSLAVLAALAVVGIADAALQNRLISHRLASGPVRKEQAR